MHIANQPSYLSDKIKKTDFSDIETSFIHCYKYKLTKPGSGEFLVATMFKQDLNSAIKNLQEQELEKNYYKKNYAGTSIEKIQYLFLHYYNNVPT